MNQKTDSLDRGNAGSTPEFSPEFVRVLVALTGATLLMVFAFEHRMFTPQGHPLIRMYLYPWIVAGGYTIANGLNEFAGQHLSVISSAQRVAALLGLLLGFVIGPTLFFFGWYHQRRDQASGTASSTLKGSTILSIIGGILTFAVALPSIPAAYFQRQSSEQLRQAQAVQDNKDQMINDINRIASDARQYRILPKDLSGGEGSYAGYTLSNSLAGTEDGSYEVDCNLDDITVKGQSKKYSDCRISVSVDQEGHLWVWRYTGSFE